MIKVEGLKNLEKKINDIPNKTMKGIKKSMDLVYIKSQPLVPVDTGKLKKSGKVVRLKNGYELKYQSFNKDYDYAPIQHENKHFRHRVGQAKYLEEPVELSMEEIKKIILQEVLK